MAENLAYKSISGCWAYENDENNLPIYGYLYNWKTATEVCPAGWHLPSDAEWTSLIDYLGGEKFADEKMKEAGTTYWKNTNIRATNESGFTALPGGGRSYNGSFNYLGSYGGWWSSSEYDANTSHHYDLGNNNNYITRNLDDKVDDFSVRCVRY